MNQDEMKAAVGKAAADLVETGMTIGLGTGSTTEFAIKALAERIRTGDLRITGTPTSFAAERLARRLGIPLITLDETDALDLALDGADEVSADFSLIKGRGGAHTREKIVASLAKRFVVLVDESKLVDRLGTRMPVPVEILPMAERPVTRALETLGARVELRSGGKKDGPVVTDQGFWILDCRFPGIDRPDELAREIKQIPGVLDHGIFAGMATDVFVGSPGGVEHRRKQS